MSAHLRSAVLAATLVLSSLLGSAAPASADEPVRLAPSRSPEIVSGLVVNKAYVTPGFSEFGWNPGGVCWAIVVLWSGGWEHSSTWCVEEAAWHRTPWLSHYDGPVLRRLTEPVSGKDTR